MTTGRTARGSDDIKCFLNSDGGIDCTFESDPTKRTVFDRLTGSVRSNTIDPRSDDYRRILTAAKRYRKSISPPEF